MRAENRWRVKPGQKVRLADWPTDATAGVRDREKAGAELADMLAELRRLQYRLYAENRRAVLVILQAMDAAGKDGVVRHVFAGLNPQGCRVTPFKVPSALENQHDFLWRIHQAVPAFGEIGVFNRSHYEDVLVVRVRKLAPPSVWQPRFAMINAFEECLSENGVTVVKLFLHVSREEQTERLIERLDDPERNWKFSDADVAEREYWDAYQEAYGEAIGRCSTRHAPWYVVPADRKWYRNWAVARILLATLQAMDLRFPAPRGDAAVLKRALQK